jgi:iron-sulfur cluster assembly protein
MNAPSLLTRRAVSVCFSCRRNLLRQRHFSTTPGLLVAAFQAYSLPSQPPPTPRNALVHDTSIATPIDSPAVPRIHDTRPPKQGAPLEAADQAAAPTSLPEKQAQQSKPDFTATPTPTPSASQQPPAQTATPTITNPPTQTPSPEAAAAEAATPAKPTPRPRSRLRARKAAINLTASAISHLRALLDQPDPKLIKVGVRNRGCSGLAYHLEYVDKPGAFDEAVEQDGVRVLIDSKALFSIIGSEMDWVEDKLSQRFVFRNPNISESFSPFSLQVWMLFFGSCADAKGAEEQCGCGESFMV